MTNSEPSAAEQRAGVVITAIGPDRPGLIQALSGNVTRLGGNIEDTRMGKLGGEFALLLFVTGTPAVLRALLDETKNFAPTLGIECFAKETRSEPSPADQQRMHLEASGVDHPGIVEKVTEVLSSWGANVTSFASRVEPAPLSGTPLFLLDVELELPSSVQPLALEKELARVCEQEQLEFILDQP